VTVLIVLLAVALAVSLAFNLGFFGQPAVPAQSGSAVPRSVRQDASPDVAAALQKAESELDKKKRDFDELKRAQNELKEELKQAKRKLFEDKEAGKDANAEDLKKARAEAERQASIQLEHTRAELAAALSEVQRLKSDADSRSKRAVAKEVIKEKPAERPETPAPQVVVQKVIRELADHEKERIARLEQQSVTDRKRAQEAERDMRNWKAKFDKQIRDVKAAYTESTLAKDKFRAVEKRLNRTLLESDMLRRALSDLEKKTGMTAERHQLTADEIADSDKRMAEKYQAEDQASAEARAKLEAQVAAEVAAVETQAVAGEVAKPN
jgi:chromosome segregation ATPase